MPRTTAACNRSDPAQQWRYDEPSGRIYSLNPAISNWCLRAGPFSSPKPGGPSKYACGHAEYVWASACNTSCCDPSGHCAEYGWKLDGNNRFVNMLTPASDVPGE